MTPPGPSQPAVPDDDAADATALNPTAASLLGLLLDGPLAAGALVTVAQQRIGGFWNLTRSQVYRELDGLAASGLVDVDPGGARGARSYVVNDAGRRAFRAWAARLPDDPTTRMPLLLLLSLGRHVEPAHLRAVLVDQFERRSRTLAGYEALLDAHGRDLDPFARATVDFGVAYERAILEWLAALPPSVRGRGPLGPREGRSREGRSTG